MSKFDVLDNVIVGNIIEAEKKNTEKGSLSYISVFDKGVYIQLMIENCTDVNEYYKLLKDKVVKEYNRRSGVELYFSVY